MDIEILSVKNKDDFFELKQRREEVAQKLNGFGYVLTYINPVDLNPKKITKYLNETAENPEKPEIVLIANALPSNGAEFFKKKFAETVAAAEHAENKPAPKDYWKKRDAAFKKAKKSGAGQEELDALTEQFRLYRKKSKIFSLGDFGNGCKGYCFMFKGIKVAVLPQAVLAGVDIRDLLLLAAVRTKEVFENSAEDYPGGFSLHEYVPRKTGFSNRFIPKKGDGVKEVVRKSVVICSFLVFFAALSFLAYNMVFLSVQNDNVNGEIQKIYHGSDETVTVASGEKVVEQKEEVDWKELKKINSDIIGWIQINDTKIDYPVLWCKTDTSKSQYYLKHNYKKEYSSWGSIFLDYRCTEGPKSKNIVLHGHHMNDGSMFGNLLKYGKYSADMDFYKKAPIITYNTPEGDGTYKIISVFKTNTLSEHGEFFNYMIGNFQNEKDFMNYVYNVRIRSLINCPVDVNEDDTLLTLSTCSYEFGDSFRTVVVARKVRDGESAKVDVSKATKNKNAVWPDVYYRRYGGTRPKVTDFCTAYDNGEIDWYNGEYDFKDQEVKETKPAETDEDTDKKKTESSSSSAQSSSQAKVYLTVTFINYDGSVISTQKVEYGKAAKAPKNPTKPSTNTYDFVFKGWQLDFSKVTKNMTIAPNFEAVEKATQAAQ